MIEGRKRPLFASPQRAGSFYAPDTPFNRQNCPLIIGKYFSTKAPPSYCEIRGSILPFVEYLLAEQNVVIAQACIKVKHIVEGVRKIYA